MLPSVCGKSYVNNDACNRVNVIGVKLYLRKIPLYVSYNRVREVMLSIHVMAFTSG